MSKKINEFFNKIVSKVYPAWSRLFSPFFQNLWDHLEYFIQLWGPWCEEEMELLEKIQRRDTELIRHLEYVSYENRLIELESFYREKRNEILYQPYSI